jgi:hypothetical protein
MAGSLSDFAELELLDHLFSAATYTAPATLYFGLYTAAPTDAGGGTEVSTGNWTNYQRAPITNNATNFPAASAGAKSNGTVISTFYSSGSTAVIPSGTVVVTHVGVFDAATAGNLLAWSDLAASKTMSNGDTISFAATAFAVTLT